MHFISLGSYRYYIYIYIKCRAFKNSHYLVNWKYLLVKVFDMFSLKQLYLLEAPWPPRHAILTCRSVLPAC